MPDTDNDQTSEARADDPTPQIVACFMNPHTLVKYYKTVAAAINNNSSIASAAGNGNTVCIVNKKSGLSRQLMMGPLDAYPMEYTHNDWNTVTEGHKHLPDLVLQRKPGLLIVISSDAHLFFNVCKTVHVIARNPLSKPEWAIFVDWARDIRAGDVYMFHRDRLGGDDFAAFELLYEIGQGKGNT